MQKCPGRRTLALSWGEECGDLETGAMIARAVERNKVGL